MFMSSFLPFGLFQETIELSTFSPHNINISPAIPRGYSRFSRPTRCRFRPRLLFFFLAFTLHAFLHPSSSGVIRNLGTGNSSMEVRFGCKVCHQPYSKKWTVSQVVLYLGFMVMTSRDNWDGIGDMQPTKKLTINRSLEEGI